jgi:hypothetical protein
MPDFIEHCLVNYAVVLHYTQQLMLLRATKPKPRSIILPRATLPKHTGATPTSRPSTTQLRMLPQSTTPRLPSTTLLPATTLRYLSINIVLKNLVKLFDASCLM